MWPDAAAAQRAHQVKKPTLISPWEGATCPCTYPILQQPPHPPKATRQDSTKAAAPGQSPPRQFAEEQLTPTFSVPGKGKQYFSRPQTGLSLEFL